MAHYDGPPFLKGEAAQPAEKYPLPPKPERRASKPKPKSATAAPKPIEPATPTVGRHSVDPLAALSTPKSVVRRDVKWPKIDYRLILQEMKRADDQVYLFTDSEDGFREPDTYAEPTDTQLPTPDLDAQRQVDDAQKPAVDAEATDEVVGDSAAAIHDESFDDQSPSTSVQPAAATVSAVDEDGTTDQAPVEEHEAATVASSSDDASEAAPVQQSETVDDAIASNAQTPADHAEQSVDSPESETVSSPAALVDDKPKASPTKLIPSQVDPLKAAQQQQLEAALAKQKKTVYANWRPIKLPQRNDLHHAVGDYKARHKDLPKPVAQVREDQHQAPQQVTSKAASETSKPETVTTEQRTPKVEAATSKAEAVAQPAKPDYNADTIALHSETTQPQSPYVFPPLDLLPKPVTTTSDEQNDWVEAQSQRLDETLDAFHVGAHVVAHTIGPTVTQFQVSLDAGVKVNKITNLNDDLKLALAAKDIRIEAPIPGKTTVGIEIPNLHPRPVMLREVLQSPAFQNAESPLTIALGVDLFGQPVVTNINKMPHGLIAGATGSGKSVFINSLLTSLLYKATPEQVRLLLIDPKAVELAVYNNLPHLVSPVISDPKAAAEALKWAVEEMENRYQKMAAAGVRNLAQFNRKAKAHGDFGLVLPYIVIIIDELADLMMVAASEVQDYIARITQKARAAGIHLIVATQRPSVDVITGTIKNNIPTRIAFMVASQTDSRTIIDANGAERLLGRGDMLYLGSGASQALRLQGTFIDEDIATVVDFVKKERPAHYLFQPDGLLAQAEASDSQDDLFPQVLEYIAQEKHVSTSKLQRVFSIGYNRAANLIDELEMRHYISPANGSKPRDVYFTKEDLADD